MSDERRRILAMLAEGKIDVAAAERLLAAVDQPSPAGERPAPKFLRVVVTGDAKVNVRVPVSLLRSGIKLSALLPGEARAKVGDALEKKGIDFDVKSLKPEQIEELLAALSDLTVDVDDGKDQVRVYCE